MKTKQRIVQLFSAILYNSYLYGFIIGGIYQGRFKAIPCPGLNCHSCPSAILACPIGVIQLFVAYGTYYVSFYVFGFLAAIGALGGRIICGWGCPFGLFQDILHKIKAPKFEIPSYLGKIRYFILIVVVFCVAYYTKEPWFCKFCPAGTLEAGISLVAINSDIRQLVGWLFTIKIAVLILFIVWMIVSKRPFCRTICPLGTLYSFFNRISLLKVTVDTKKCIKCNACFEKCPVSIKVYERGGGTGECIRCCRCTICPTGAITISTKE